MNHASKIIGILLALVLAVPVAVGAESTGKAAEKTEGQSARKESKAVPIAYEDVEELNDNLDELIGKRVVVKGEIEEKHAPRAVTLESGGLINDEIIVLAGDTMKPVNFSNLEEDAEIRVTGTIQAVAVTDLDFYYDWDMDPTVSRELEGVKAYLVADSIEIIERD